MLPFKLPTWNQLLAMNPWQRKKVRDWIHQYVYTAILQAKDLETVTDVVLKPSWTPLLEAEYLLTIQPNASRKYRLRKMLETKIKRLSK